MYLVENLTPAEIGVVYDCAKTSILDFLRKHNVPIKSRSQVNKEVANRKEHQDRRRSKMVGKPSGAAGKTWKLQHRKHSPNIQGSKNPNWKGGKTSLVRTLRDLPEYKSWRLAVFLRDSLTCIHCGSTVEKTMQADHIVPFSVLLDDYQITTVESAIQCKELWEVSNGRTLCEECHRKTDTWGPNLTRTKRA